MKTSEALKINGQPVKAFKDAWLVLWFTGQRV